jgi:hypothetical protein
LCVAAGFGAERELFEEECGEDGDGCEGEADVEDGVE